MGFIFSSCRDIKKWNYSEIDNKQEISESFTADGSYVLEYSHVFLKKYKMTVMLNKYDTDRKSVV